MRLTLRTRLACTLPFGFLIFNTRVAKGNRSGQESILLPQPDSTELFLPFDRTQNNSRNRTMSLGGGRGNLLCCCPAAQPCLTLSRTEVCLGGNLAGPWVISGLQLSLQPKALKYGEAAAMLAMTLPKPQPVGDRCRSPKRLTGTLGKAHGLQPDKRGSQMCWAAQDRAYLEPVS